MTEQGQGILFEKVDMGYGKKPVLQNVNLSLEMGEIHCVFGRNGSGKTTFLKTFSGLLPSQGGSILVQAKNLNTMSATQRSKKMALVLSDSLNLPAMTVKDYISFGRYPYRNWFGSQQPEDLNIIEMAMVKCGLKSMEKTPVNLMSEGEKQKVQLARALTQETALLLLDEPTSHLDLVNKAEIFHILKQIRNEESKTIVFTSHDLQFAMQLADHFLVVDQQGISKMSKDEFKSKKVYESILKSDQLHFDPATNAVRFL